MQTYTSTKRTLAALILVTMSTITAWAQFIKYELVHSLHKCDGNLHSEKLVVLDDKKQEITDQEFALVGDLAEARGHGGARKIAFKSGFIIDSLREVYASNRVFWYAPNGDSVLVGEFETFKVENGLIAVKSFEPVEPSCRPRSGCIVLNGLPTGSHFDFYVNNSAEPVFKNVKTNADGQVVILGQDAGTYKNIYVKSGGCESSKGEMTLSEPPKPPTPWVKESAHSGEGSVRLLATGKGKMQWYVGDSLIQTGNIFTTPPLSKSTTYTVYANDDDCISKPTTVVAHIHEPLAAYELKSERLSDGSKGIFLEKSQSGAVYRLYRDEEIVKEILGTGEKIHFGAFDTEGVYTAKAFVFENTEKRQKGQVTINKQK